MKKLNTAIIMCAGFGKRLKPLTNKVPKPLLKIDNKSLLENTIDLLFKLNINKIFLNSHHLSQQIKRFLLEKYKFFILIISIECFLVQIVSGFKTK